MLGTRWCNFQPRTQHESQNAQRHRQTDGQTDGTTMAIERRSARSQWHCRPHWLRSRTRLSVEFARTLKFELSNLLNVRNWRNQHDRRHFRRRFLDATTADVKTTSSSSAILTSHLCLLLITWLLNIHFVEVATSQVGPVSTGPLSRKLVKIFTKWCHILRLNASRLLSTGT